MAVTPALAAPLRPPGAALPAPSPTLARCLLLAVLLHLWAVLLLGNAPGGTARPGEGVWGSINVTLRGPETRGATALPPPAPELREGPPGEAPAPRYGGAVREAAPAPEAEPGAAQLGRWADAPAPVPPAVAPLPPTPAAAVPTPVPLPPLPPPPPGRVVEESLSLPPLAAPQAALAAPAPLAPPPAVAVPAPALAAPLAAPPPEPVLRRLEGHATGTAARADTAAPLAPTPTLTAPAAALPLPQALAAALPSPTALRPAMAAPAAESQPLAPTPAMTPAPAPAPLPGPPALQAPLRPAPAPATPGLPDAGSRVGADVATPPAAAASTPPRLNLELARPRGGELSRGGARGVLPVLPRPPELDGKLARDIEKAAKEECRKAHAGNGLLALGPLLADALKKDGGCKW